MHDLTDVAATYESDFYLIHDAKIRKLSVTVTESDKNSDKAKRKVGKSVPIVGELNNVLITCY